MSQIHCTRVRVALKFGSQVLPPSSENDCSKWWDVGVMSDQTQIRSCGACSSLQIPGKVEDSASTNPVATEQDTLFLSPDAPSFRRSWLLFFSFCERVGSDLLFLKNPANPTPFAAKLKL